MGLRKGTADFFAPTDAALLAQRSELLSEHPLLHAAMLAEGAPVLHELVGFTARWVREKPPTLTGAALCRWLGERLEPDFLLLLPEAGGKHRLAGGCLCFPTKWDLREKLGLGLEAIHEPVPTLNENLAARIDAFLSALKPGPVWQRWNWSLTASPALNLHPATSPGPVSEAASLADTWLRLEEQTFLRLPETRGILFAIRIQAHRLTQIPPFAAARLAEWLNSMPESVAHYKGLAAARRSLVRALRAAAETKPAHPA